jgi:hypothetical protein
MKGEDYVMAASMVSSDLYQQLVAKAEDGGIVYSDAGASLVIFPNSHVYYGGYYNGIRSGEGVWLRGDSDADQYSFFRGQWENDLPNGRGMICSVRDERRIEKVEGYTYALYNETTGIFQDGLYHGTFSFTSNMDNGHVHQQTPTFVSGVGQALPDADTREDLNLPPHLREAGNYVVSKCESCGSILAVSPGSIHRVFGLFD